MNFPLNPLAIVLPPLMGAVACLAIGHLGLWLGRRADHLSLWVGAWCVNTLVFIGSHYVQVTTEDGARAVLAGRWAWSSALVMIPLLIGVTHALVGERPSRRALLVASLLSAVLIAGVWIGEAMIANRWYVRTDRLSGVYLAVAPGPLQPLALPYILAAFAYCMRVMARARSLGVWERRLFLGGMVVYAAMAVNDALHAARIIESGRVFDFAFVGFAVGLTYFHARRYNRVQSHLEEEVAARTTELAGLVRAGRIVLGGLDLDATLTRIVEEAARIAGTPHVKLLLVDKDLGILRLVAIAGATAPKDFTVPFGQSYSGTVAATGEPMFIGDTQNDPLNLLAQRDREQGIRTYLGLPVRFGSEVVGVLTLNTETARPWTPDQLAFLGSFADVAAVAIGNARLYAAATNQGRRLAALADLTQSLTSTLDLDQVLDRVVQQAVALFEPAVARLWLVDEGGQTLSLRAHAGAKAEAGGVVRMAVGEGLMGSIAASRTPLVVDDVQADSRIRNLGRIRAEGTISFAGVPLVLGDRILGTLGLALSKRHQFAAEEVGLLQTLAGHAAVAIENARLYQALEERLARQQALTRLTRLISGSLDTPTVLAEISRAAARIMDSPLALFWVADPAGNRLLFSESSDPVLAADFPLREMRFDDGIIGWIATHRQPLVVADVYKDPRFKALDWWRRHGLKSFYGLPVMLEGVLLAVLTFNSRRPFDLSPADQDFLDSFVAQAALAIHNATLFETEAHARREVELALAQVKQLHGMLPICAYCKKVRNDRNYWETIESYIGERSAATFSHGICPECRDKVVGPELERWKRSQQGP